MSEPGKNGKRGYSWEPFAKGNKRGVIHGARDEARVAELAEKFAAGLLADPNMPDYLKEPELRPAVDGYARSAVIVDLLWAYLADKDITEAMADVTDTSEQEERVSESGEDDRAGARTPRRRLTRRQRESQHVASALRQLERHEATLTAHRGRLGLDPAGLLALGRSVTRPSPSLTEAIDELGRQMGDEP